VIGPASVIAQGAAQAASSVRHEDGSEACLYPQQVVHPVLMCTLVAVLPVDEPLGAGITGSEASATGVRSSDDGQDCCGAPCRNAACTQRQPPIPHRCLPNSLPWVALVCRNRPRSRRALVHAVDPRARTALGTPGRRSPRGRRCSTPALGGVSIIQPVVPS